MDQNNKTAHTMEISEDGFLNMLRHQNGGAVIDELDRELIKGVKAILDNGGSSDITLKIKISRIKNMEAAMSISHDVVAKHPKEDRPQNAMFINNDCGLIDHPQEQKSLGFGEAVEKPSSLPAASTTNVSQLNKG